MIPGHYKIRIRGISEQLTPGKAGFSIPPGPKNRISLSGSQRRRNETFRPQEELANVGIFLAAVGHFRSFTDDWRTAGMPQIMTLLVRQQTIAVEATPLFTY
jgi:hypothetical protein